MAGSPRFCAETWQSERGFGGVGSGRRGRGGAEAETRTETQTHNQQQGRRADKQHLMDTSDDSKAQLDPHHIDKNNSDNNV